MRFHAADGEVRLSLHDPMMKIGISYCTVELRVKRIVPAQLGILRQLFGEDALLVPPPLPGRIVMAPACKENTDARREPMGSFQLQEGFQGNSAVRQTVRIVYKNRERRFRAHDRLEEGDESGFEHRFFDEPMRLIHPLRPGGANLFQVKTGQQ
jgi:hypothetical protein